MLRRLAIALTTLLGLVGATVVAGYLLVFSVGTDRVAAAVPADAAVYATVYLQPTTGQQMNLAALMSNVPGFADAASLDQKIHEISARFLGQAGIDYEADVRPWIGNQLSLAARPGATLADQPRWLLLASVKDPALARAAMDRIAVGRGLTAAAATYQDVQISVADGLAWAIPPDLLIVAPDRAALEEALDAYADRRPSLAHEAEYIAAMRRLPADHLAAAYVDLDGLAQTAGIGDELGGYSAAGAALLVEPTGLRLEAIAPFDVLAASSTAREAFAMASEPSSLADWMPPDTQLAAVVFGLRRSVATAEEALAGEPGAEQITHALDQLRAVAALGLGINLDDDLLSLFDAEAGLAVTDLTAPSPHGQLLLRPADADAAAASLARMLNALEQHGAQFTEREADGTTVTSVDIPQVGSLSWAMFEGVIVAGLDYQDVASALAARASGDSLANGSRYRAAWQLAGERGGNEAYLDIGSVVDSSDDALGMTGDARDILLSLAALGMTAPARDDTSELHAVLTVR